MKNILNKITTGEGAKFNLLLILSLIFSIGIGGCTGNFNIGKNDSNTTNKVEDNRKTDINSAENSAGNVEKINNSAKKPDENVEKSDASPEVPSEAQLQAMTKETLLNFNDAVQKGDFTDFQSKISDLWKKTAKPETFNQGFKEFIDKKIEISNIKDATATFDPKPTVTKKSGYNVLTVNGNYDTSPLPVRFFTEYVNQDGEWKLISIKVDTRK